MTKANDQDASAKERGTATRQRLLDAAFALVAEAGWGGVTTRMVAERAGVNPGLVHYHFASVNDLLSAACLGVAREMLRETQGRLVEYVDAGEGVDWMLDALLPYAGNDPASRTISEMFLAATRDPHLRAGLNEIVVEFRSEVAAWLRRLGHDDAEATAIVLAATVDGLVMHRGLDPDLDMSTVHSTVRRLLSSKEVRA